MVNTKLCVANTLTCQIAAILRGEKPVATMQNNNGNTYHVLLKMPFTPIDEGYYIGSWQMYRYAIVLNPINEELSIVSMLGEKEWDNTHRYVRLNKPDASDDIWYILSTYVELGKQYYGCEDIDCIFNKNKYRGLGRIDYVWHGSQAYPELIYDNESFCYWGVEDALHEIFKDEVVILDEWVANLRVEV